MRTATTLCLLIAALVGCGDSGYPVPTVTYEAIEFSAPVAKGGEGDTIAKDGVFNYEFSTTLRAYLKYDPEDNIFHGAVSYSGYFVPAKNVRVEVWLSNGWKLEPKPIKSMERGRESVVFKATDMPFASWQARVSQDFVKFP